MPFDARLCAPSPSGLIVAGNLNRTPSGGWRVGEKAVPKIPMTPEAAAILKKQLADFRKKFGRDPGPNDPVFFDPTKDEPTEIDPQAFAKDVVAAMKAAKTPPQIIYAYEKTGRLLTSDNLDKYPPEAIAEWEAAIDDYFDKHPEPPRGKGKRKRGR